VRGHVWAPAQATQTPQGCVSPLALGSTSRPNLKALTPTSPQCENDNSCTCVDSSGRQLRRRRRDQEVELLERWAQQADQTLKSLPPPLQKHHNAKTKTAARAWARLGARSGATNTTRRFPSSNVGLLRPTKRRRPRPDPPRRVNDNSRTCVDKSGRQPGRHKRHKEVYLLRRRAPQATQTSAPLPPTITSTTTSTTTTHKGHELYLLGRAGV